VASHLHSNYILCPGGTERSRSAGSFWSGTFIQLSDKIAHMFNNNREGNSAFLESADLWNYVVTEAMLDVRSQVCMCRHRHPLNFEIREDATCSKRMSVTAMMLFVALSSSIPQYFWLQSPRITMYSTIALTTIRLSDASRIMQRR